MFKGAIVAIATPFKNGEVDEGVLRDLVAFQIKNGIHGIVPCGTTGESPTLSHEEHNKVVDICVEAAAGAVPVIAGTGSNSTAEAIKLTQHALDAGANAALIVTPYYNRPTQKGLYLHFKAIADNVNIPIILYNIESRTARNIETDTVARLAQDCKNIVGVKEASGSLEQVKAVRDACSKDFIILSGDDALTIPMMELGGSGVISVVANIVPGDVAGVVNACNKGQLEEAKKINERLRPLIKSMFVETNPIPVKKAMELMGLCSAELRLPLCEMEESKVEEVRRALESYGLLTQAGRQT